MLHGQEMIVIEDDTNKIDLLTENSHPYTT